MIIEQIYTGCLSQGAYYIESAGEAVIIDPLREVEPYIQKAKENKATIIKVLETHFHADFVSGHIDLAKKTSAQIVFGPGAKPGFEAHVAKDNEIIPVGNCHIRVIHTPGHTLESSCYLLSDEQGKDVALFTGDTLFIGDVGRPDLAQKVMEELTEEVLAGYLYDSLRYKIMPLDNDIIVYPAHGAGSACGKNMSKETTDSLGNQKATNYALQDMSKTDFITKVLDGLLPPPMYFPENVRMNSQGYEGIDVVLSRGLQALTPQQFEDMANETGAVILDTRNAQEFAQGFIPNSINIGIDGGFAPWVGALIPHVTQPILIVADNGREEEVVTRLARVGYDFTMGYLVGGFKTWDDANREVDQITTISAKELSVLTMNELKPSIIDVRKASEFASEQVVTAINRPLDFINVEQHKIDPSKTYYVHCAGGYRSMIFISILKARGFQYLIDVQGGFNAIKQEGTIPLTNFICPSTL